MLGVANRHGHLLQTQGTTGERLAKLVLAQNAYTFLSIRLTRVHKLTDISAASVALTQLGVCVKGHASRDKRDLSDQFFLIF